MVALSARRFVCSAIAVMILTASPMRVEALESSLMRLSVCSAWCTASSAILLDCSAWRAISVTETASCSDADATDCTLEEASSEALATMPDNCWVVSAVCVREFAAASRLVAADDTVRTISPTAISNPSASLRMSAWRCAAVPASSSRRSVSSVSMRCKLSLNAVAARALSPTSSARSA